MGENSGGMQSKRIYKCFFKPLNTNFSKFFAQIWHFHKTKKQTKKPDPVFSHFTVGSGEGNITIFFFWPYEDIYEKSANLSKVTPVYGTLSGILHNKSWSNPSNFLNVRLWQTDHTQGGVLSCTTVCPRKKETHKSSTFFWKLMIYQKMFTLLPKFSLSSFFWHRL